MNQHVRCALSVLAAAAASAAGSARAEISVDGDVALAGPEGLVPATPTDPWDVRPCVLYVTQHRPDLPVDDPAYGEVYIETRGEMISAGAVVGSTNGRGSLRTGGATSIQATRVPERRTMSRPFTELSVMRGPGARRRQRPNATVEKMRARRGAWNLVEELRCCRNREGVR